MSIAEEIKRAEETTADVHRQRKALLKLPRDERGAHREELLRSLTEAMTPIRSALGRVVWGGCSAREEAQLRIASTGLKRERAALGRMRWQDPEGRPQGPPSTSTKYRHRAKARAYAYVSEAKARMCCFDCGYSFPNVAMDFDHVHGDQQANVARLCSSGASNARLEVEMAKCELVCANCHRVRTRDRPQAEP